MEKNEFREYESRDISSFDGVKQVILSTLGINAKSKQMILACEEIYTNIKNYSGADEVSFSFNRTDAEYRVTFSDDGVPFDPVAAEVPHKELEELDSGGMGIMLAMMNSKEMVYDRKNDKNILTLKFDVE